VTSAGRLVARLILIQLAVGAATEAFVIAFAPKLLLLDSSVLLGSLPIAIWISVIMIVWDVVATLLATRELRPALRAIASASPDSAAVKPGDLVALYALPARLTTLDLVAAAVVALRDARERRAPGDQRSVHAARARPPHDDDGERRGAPAVHHAPYVGDARARAAPQPAAGAALEMIDMKRASRVRSRLLASVAGPVAFVALGASLLVYAHARAFDVSARESDASELARGVFDLVGGDGDGRKEADRGGARARDPARARPRPGGLRRAAHEDGETRAHGAARLGPRDRPLRDDALEPGDRRLPVPRARRRSRSRASWERASGRSFTADLSLATREVRATGVEDVIRGTRVTREPRFRSVAALLDSISELGGVFREFAAAQEKSIVARAAAERMRGLFLASISHDLKGPLNSILGFTELVRERADRGAARASRSSSSAGASSSSSSRRSSTRPAPRRAELQLANELTMVGDVVMSAVLDAKELAVGTGVDIVAEIQPGVPRLFVDPTRIIQAITAVIMSAVRFSEKGPRST
jgi:hypothetical protein